MWSLRLVSWGGKLALAAHFPRIMRIRDEFLIVPDSKTHTHQQFPIFSCSASKKKIKSAPLEVLSSLRRRKDFP